jgi:hypothetical protein
MLTGLADYFNYSDKVNEAKGKRFKAKGKRIV